MCCGVAAIVSDSAASLTGYVASTATPKTNKQNAQKTKTAGTETARNFLCDVIMSTTSAWSTEFALHVLHSKYPKNERNKTRLTLAPNRGSLEVL